MRYDNETGPLPDIMAQEQANIAALEHERDMFKMKSMNQEAIIDGQSGKIAELEGENGKLTWIIEDIIGEVNSWHTKDMNDVSLISSIERILHERTT